MNGFIKLIIVAATAVSLSSPVRAGDDVVNVIAGLLGVVLLGAVISDLANTEPVPVHAPVQPHHPKVHRPVDPRPLPKNVQRYVLPERCVVPVKTRKHHSVSFLRPACLKKHYRHAANLPKSCKKRVWSYNEGAYRDRFSISCLNTHGYRVAEH